MKKQKSPRQAMQLQVDQCHQLALTAHAAAEQAHRAEAQAKQAEARSRHWLYLCCAVATAHALTAILRSC